MRAVMMMFDSLNRALLSPYGCTDVPTPNFERLARRSVRFDNCYAGSLPCMPARRELQTGRYNFLHRSWGPMEPFDDSVPMMLDRNGIYTHLISDHTHYWEDGGSTYHNRYSSWENVRGQEGDHWKVLPELMRPYREEELQNKDGKYFHATRGLQRHDRVNRTFMQREEDTCMARTVNLGLDFIRNNREADQWFLQIECFDPHEPFFVPEKYKEMFPDEYEGKPLDWPPYHHVTEDAVSQKHLKNQYKALLAMCDEYLGRLLDVFDEYDLWKDTMLIVNTDHGYLLGEHGWWSKIVMPCYDEIVHTPLFIHDPRFDHDGESREQIVQTIDIAASLLEFFGVGLPADMQGRPVSTVIGENKPIRDYALFGIHGAHVNVFDGKYVYMRSPVSGDNKPLFEYTVMPMHMRNLFSVDEMRDAVQEPGSTFSFTKGCPVWKIPKGNGNGKLDFSDLLIHGMNSEDARHIDNNSMVNSVNFGDKLFDMEKDPRQEENLTDVQIRVKMAKLMVRAMKENESPSEQFERIGLPETGEITEDMVRCEDTDPAGVPCLPDCEWEKGAVNMFRALMKFIPEGEREKASKVIENGLKEMVPEAAAVSSEMIEALIPAVIPAEHVDMVAYFTGLSGRTS